MSGQCSEKTDVFGFGVFLMELVSGKDVYQLSVQAEAEDVLLRDWVSATCGFELHIATGTSLVICLSLSHVHALLRLCPFPSWPFDDAGLCACPGTWVLVGSCASWHQYCFAELCDGCLLGWFGGRRCRSRR